MGLLVLGLVLFILLVVVHEFGHFIIARRNGVIVEEFGIFFPPRLWSRRTKKGWLFSINILPLGGFVRLHGEHDSDTGVGTFGAATTWVKTKIMLAGVFMNLLAAFVLLMILAWVGMPQLVPNQFTVKSDTHIAKSEVLVGYVEKNSPASGIGLKSSDRLISMQANGGKLIEIKQASKLPGITASLAGKTVQIRYDQNGTIYTKKTTLRSTDKNGYLGIAPTQYTLLRYTWSAPIVAGGLIGQFTALTFHGLGMALKGLGSIVAGLVTGNHAAREAGQTVASSQVSGPVGIFMLLKHGSRLGYQFILSIIAIISLSLAIMNILPIPALDGGKLFVTLLSRLFGKKLSETAENAIYGTGFALLMLLIVIITIVDVKRNF